jgi:ABC-type nickel/cobalt efflux system permease component RcnA
VAEETLSFWMGIASGVLIVAIGVALFLRRYRAWVLSRGGHEQGHEKRKAQSEKRKLGGGSAGGGQGPKAPRPQGLSGHPASPSATPGQAGHGNGHSHVAVSPDGTRPSYWSILGLGISGGIVPCPTALIVLLLAIRFGRLGYGLLLILAFSLGLALVLIVLGVLVVRASSVVQRMTGTRGRLQLLSVLSSAVIVLLGVWVVVWTLLQYNVLVFRPGG